MQWSKGTDIDLQNTTQKFTTGIVTVALKW